MKYLWRVHSLNVFSIIWFGALMAQTIVSPTFSNDCVVQPCLDRGPATTGSIGRTIPIVTGNLLPKLLLRLLLVCLPIGKTAMYIMMKIVCMGTHCLKPFSPQLGLENGASMAWMPCKYRWRRCAGTMPRNSPCDHFPQVAFWECPYPHSSRISFLQPIFKGCAGTIC